jgi:hypothetical protein
VEEVRSALNEHADVVAEFFGRVSTELRGGFAPAVDTFVGFFHAVDWKVRVRLLFSPSFTDSLASTSGWFHREVAGVLPCKAATVGSQCPTEAVVSLFHALPVSL